MIRVGWGGTCWGVDWIIVLVLVVLIGEGIVVFFSRTSAEVALDVVHILLLPFQRVKREEDELSPTASSRQIKVRKEQFELKMQPEKKSGKKQKI